MKVVCVLSITLISVIKRLITLIVYASVGWADIGYNFVVGEDGRVYEGRSWDKVGAAPAHTYGWNRVAISICFMGDYCTKLPPQKALNAAQELLKFGVANGKLTPDYRLYGHRDALDTESPGQMLYDLIKTWDHFDHDATRPLPRPEPPTPAQQ